LSINLKRALEELPDLALAIGVLAGFLVFGPPKDFYHTVAIAGLEAFGRYAVAMYPTIVTGCGLAEHCGDAVHRPR
jgi:hypothetical protein